MPDQTSSCKRNHQDNNATPNLRQRTLNLWLKRTVTVTAVITVALVLGIATTVLVLRYAILPHLNAFRPRLEQMLARTIGTPVSIGALAVHWQAWQPSIEVTALTLFDAQGHAALRMPHIAAILSWHSLLLFKPTLTSLRIDAPHAFAHRTADGNILVAGVPLAFNDYSNGHRGNALIRWLLSQQTIVLRQGTLHWQDEMRAALPMALTDLRLAISNRGRQHRIGLSANIDSSATRLRSIPRPIDLQAQFRHPIGSHADDIAHWVGTAHISAGPLDLPALSRSLSLPSSSSLPIAAIHSGQLSLCVRFKFNASHQISGVLSFASRQLSMAVKKLFDAPTLDFDTLSGKASWTLQPASIAQTIKDRTIKVHLDHLAFSQADAAGSVRASYQKKGHSRGYLDLEANLQRAAIARIPRYLPQRINAKLRAYLSHALVAGTVHNATVRMAGKLEDLFPLTASSERKTVKLKKSVKPMPDLFQIIAPFDGGRFDPTPLPMHKATKTTIDGAAVSNATEQREQWPAIDHICGIFRLDRRSLSINIDHARYRSVIFKRIHGYLNDLSMSANDLVLDGRANGPLDDMLHYLRASPIPHWIGYSMDPLKVKGNAGLTLTLRIPRDGRTRLGVVGALQFAHNTLAIGSLPPLTEAKGQLTFNRRSLTLKQITAQFLGGEMSAEGGIRPDGSVAAMAVGRLSAQAVISELCGDRCSATAFTPQLAGSAPYQVSLYAPPESALQIAVNSDLTGLKINLPAPFTKAAAAPMPLRFIWHQQPVSKAEPTPAANVPLTQINLQLGPLSAAYLRRDGERPTILNGALSFDHPNDPNDATTPNQSLSDDQYAVNLSAASKPAVTATAHFDQLDLDAWRAAIDELMGYVALNPSKSHWLLTTLRPYLPTRIRAHFNTLILAHQRWKNLQLNAEALQDHHIWRAKLNSAQIAGLLAWQPTQHGGMDNSTGLGRLEARLTRLAIMPTEQKMGVGSGAQTLTTHARYLPLPAINATIDELLIHGHNLGRLKIAAHNTRTQSHPLWQLNQLQLTHPAAKLTATGNFTALGSPSTATNTTNHPISRTHCDFRLEIGNAGALLEQLGLPRTLRNGSGALLGKIDWLGPPASIDQSTLTGSLSLDLRRGQIVRADPGLSKLLGVLSLQSLVRFLTFDFRDVFGKGLTFEQISATGVIRGGKVRTDDFAMTSINAKITMKGFADMVKEQQNLLVTIRPMINVDSAALAATMVNPLLGVGSYIAQRMLLASIARNFTTQYTVSGSWAHPQIKKLLPN